jgi:hypothetical protein
MTRRATHDPALAARVVRSLPLLYADGADPALDRPAHVRSASGLAWVDGVLAVIQDDAHFVAVADPRTGLCRALTLPAGEGGARQFDDVRGNKRFKLDLEACTAVPDREGGEVLLAFGSGSTAARESVLMVWGLAGPAPEIRLFPAPAFYAGLRAAGDFAGSELNVEGAAYHAGRILLVNRGNGAPSAAREAVDAVCSVDWPRLRDHLHDPAASPPPPPEEVVRYDLGTLGGSRLTFTDLAATDAGLCFTAAAEDSPNAVDDGPVTGSAVGWVDAEGAATLVAVTDAEGAPLVEKIEGIAPGTRPGTLLLCTDPDAPDVPSRLLEVEVTGEWLSGRRREL